MAALPCCILLLMPLDKQPQLQSRRPGSPQKTLQQAPLESSPPPPPLGAVQAQGVEHLTVASTGVGPAHACHNECSSNCGEASSSSSSSSCRIHADSHLVNGELLRVHYLNRAAAEALHREEVTGPSEYNTECIQVAGVEGELLHTVGGSLSIDPHELCALRAASAWCGPESCM